jgi:hypothetical protein
MKRNSGAIEEKLSFLYNAEYLFETGTEKILDYNLINPCRNFSTKTKRASNPSNTTYILNNLKRATCPGRSFILSHGAEYFVFQCAVQKNND